MIQDLIVLLLILAAIANIIYQLVRIFRNPKEDEFMYGGCEQCQLNKSIGQHDQQ